uniref:YABBY transcription factor n=1 Tax=Kalanchoe fedtschenkoi TaxID=63787 RepID=A0A7N0VL12_KALFE
MEVGSERVCYVHCNFCDTVLAVSVPCTSMLNIVTVRCGHCANLLSANMGALLEPCSIQDLPQKQQQTGAEGALVTNATNVNYSSGSSSSSSPSKCNTNKLSGSCESSESDQPHRLPPVRPMEKRQRVPSAYNRFIKEEIQRIKAGNPEISHREAFSAAAKNWAHFPHIHFGMKKAKFVDQDQLASRDRSGQKSFGFN